MYAKQFSEESGFPLSENISQSDRFCLYKTGPVLWVNVRSVFYGSNQEELLSTAWVYRPFRSC